MGAGASLRPSSTWAGPSVSLLGRDPRKEAEASFEQQVLSSTLSCVDLGGVVRAVLREMRLHKWPAKERYFSQDLSEFFRTYRIYPVEKWPKFFARKFPRIVVVGRSLFCTVVLMKYRPTHGPTYPWMPSTSTSRALPTTLGTRSCGSRRRK